MYLEKTALQVKASDGDMGENAAITYHLPHNVTNYVHVHSITGQIEAVTPFDREVKDTLVFYVLAVDSGSPSRTGSALVSITIGDVNDETPKFSQLTYTFNVSENLPQGSAVGTLSAADKDASPFNEFTFSFYTGQGAADKDAFKLNPKTGVITTAKVLDREKQQLYHLVALVIDVHMPERSSTATVTIVTLDENDNDPTFIYPSRSNNTIFISNSLPVGGVLAHVSATDKDAGRNAVLSYSLQTAKVPTLALTTTTVGKRKTDRASSKQQHASFPNDEDVKDRFRINPAMGTITAVRSLLDITEEVYVFLVVVMDHGSPCRQANITLTVVVNASIVYFPPSLPGLGQSQGQGWMAAFASGERSLTTFLVIGCVCGALIVIFIIAISAAMFCRHQNIKHQKQNSTVCIVPQSMTAKYNCRTTEATWMLKDQTPHQLQQQFHHTTLLINKNKNANSQTTKRLPQSSSHSSLTLTLNSRKRSHQNKDGIVTSRRCNSALSCDVTDTYPCTPEFPLPPPPPHWTNGRAAGSTATLSASILRKNYLIFIVYVEQLCGISILAITD